MNNGKEHNILNNIINSIYVLQKCRRHLSGWIVRVSEALCYCRSLYQGGCRGRIGSSFKVILEIAYIHILGFCEVFRNISLKTVGTSAIQSRACAVLANGKYVFALPGSSGGVTDAWDGILKHQLDINHKPCNFVELFPRLKEK